MKSGCILAIDQGTTNTKALLFDLQGKILASGSSSAPITYPAPGWAEQDPEAIWQSVVEAIAAVCVSPEAENILAVGITNQRESALVWDRVSGAALGPCISWQCRRTAGLCKQLSEDGQEEEILATTGLRLDPLFSATKISWLLDEIPGARLRAEAGELCAGTVDSWLLYMLTGTHATDPGNASRTQLLALDSAEWSARMQELFRVPEQVLPQILPSNASFGETLGGRTALPGGIPVRAVMGDSHAAILGQGGDDRGRAKVTIGTGSSLMVTTGGEAPSSRNLSNTVAWSDERGCKFALEGNIAISGHAVAYASALLGIGDEKEFTELAGSVQDSGGITFVPALAGIGAPFWQPDARGLISGMSLSTRPAHIARATLEAIALQINDVFEQMELELGHSLVGVSVDGGGAKNDLLLQLLADVLHRQVERTGCAEASALGVARKAAQSIGLSMPAPIPAATFVPKIGREAREILLRRWKWAVSSACRIVPGGSAQRREQGSKSPPLQERNNLVS